MGKAIGWLGVAIIVSVFVAGFIAYFVFSLDPSTGITHDGFGRQLYEPPWIIRLVFHERQWAGCAWFITDMILFWGCLSFGLALARRGFKSKTARRTPKI